MMNIPVSTLFLQPSLPDSLRVGEIFCSIRCHSTDFCSHIMPPTNTLTPTGYLLQILQTISNFEELLKSTETL